MANYQTKWMPCLTLALSLILNRAHAQPTNQLRPWREYRTIMWIGDSAYKQPSKWPLFLQRLREMGINTGMVSGDGDPLPMVENHFPYYVENIVNRGLCLKWNSQVRDWDAFVTGWSKAGRPASALVRDYCLDDPKWRGWAADQVRRSASKNRPFAPVAYNLRDELSTTISANPFDYDFNPIALAQFRQWLQTQYPDLTALNAQWDTAFTNWDAVKPFTTDEIKNRMASGVSLPRGSPDWQRVEALKFDPLRARQSPAGWNFSPWVDFRSYMDLSLARCLGELRAAARAVDPQTPVGIEGTQMPDAFGGYDLWRLSRVLDWVEPYDIGNAREILASFMPGQPVLTTVFESDANHARRRLWHLLLEGDRGCIVWWSEDCIDWKSEDYALTAKARALTPVLKEMTSPLARLFLLASPEHDPIFLLYSQPSIQVDWLLESTVDGSTWLRRFSSFEASHNRLAKTRNAWVKAFEDLGFSPQFISSEELEAGRLRSMSAAMLVLPTAYALSDKELHEIGLFLSATNSSVSPQPHHQMLWDGAPGWFDQHGKLRHDNPLDRFASAPPGNGVTVVAASAGEPAAWLAGNIADYAQDRLASKTPSAWPDWIARHLAAPPTEVTVPGDAHVEIHRFHLPGARLLAFERNIEYQMSEDLKQAGGNETLEKPVDLDAQLQQPAHVYDLRTEKYLGRTNRIHFTLDPWQPSLFALTAEKLPDGSSLLESLTPR
jgi:Beta-galactosidase